LFAVQELVAFARVTKLPSAKPACIRRLYFRFPDYFHQRHPPPDFEKVAEEAQRCFSVALRHLPAHLDVFHVMCATHRNIPNEVLYQSLYAACQDPAWAIEVPVLVIGSRGGICDFFKYFAFARNTVHLVLTINDFDEYFHEFDYPLPSMQLESLVLHMQCSDGTFSSCLSRAASAATQALRPACIKLQSLTLNLYEYDQVKTHIYAEAVKHVLSLTGPSTSVLGLCAKPVNKFTNLAWQLANADAFPQCPTLQYMHLDASGVFSGVFQRIGCSELRQLEVTVTETLAASSRDGAETMWDVLACMELAELANLEGLIVNFGSGETFDATSPPSSSLGPWSGTKETWKPLEEACVTRNIACHIRHPESTL